MVERCPDCNAVLEQYDDETIGLCIVVLSTYIHREPSLATPLLLESLIAVSRYVYDYTALYSSAVYLTQGTIRGYTTTIREFGCCI